MTSARTKFKSLFGSAFGLGDQGQLSARYKGGATIVNLTRKAVHADITISAEAATTADTRDITIQLRDIDGKAMTEVEQFEIVMFSDATMTDFVAAGGSTGVQAGATGKLLAVVAKKLFRAQTSATGLWVGSYLDTATAAGYLAVRLPNGRLIGGGLVTNA